MADVYPAYFDRVRYKISSKNQGSLIIDEPIGWNNDEKEYARHDKYHGIMVKFSNSLRFNKNGADFIRLAYELFGINEEITLTKYEKHPRTDEWILSYNGYLDLSTFEDEEGFVSVKFNSGGIEQLLKARESEKVEIDRNTTIDGQLMQTLEPIEIVHTSRRIFLKTNYRINAQENFLKMLNSTNGNTRGSNYPVPFQIVNRSHENAHSPIVGTRVGDNNWDRSGNGEVGLLFFAVSDRDRVLHVKYNLRFDTKFETSINPISGNEYVSGYDDVNFFNFYVFNGKYGNGQDYAHISSDIQYFKENFNDIHNQSHNVFFEGDIHVSAGESLSVAFGQNMDGANGHEANLRIEISNIEGELFVEENSYYEPTKSKGILIYDVVDRLVEICTSKKNAVHSEFLGRTDLGYPFDGKGGLFGLTHGFWVRGFDKYPLPTEGPPPVENLFKPLTTSLRDCLDSLHATLNLGLGIEQFGAEEKVRIEHLSYFYNPNVTIRLPHQVKKLKRSVDANYYFSSAEIGYEKGGEYEEACGLDEFNTRSTFTTIINRVKNVYMAISKYRSDTYGLEFARRKQNSNNTEDSPYDNDIWILDLKRGIESEEFLQRTYEDDFAEIPTGIFSPETATNLRLSPLNCLLRHGWWLSAGLIKYLTGYVRYSSSGANNRLKTKLKFDELYKSNPSNMPGNGYAYAENGDIINSEISNPRFIPEVIEFEHICDFDIMEQLNGKTIISNKEIRNVYGLVEFINERGEKERGYLLGLSPNGAGKWKLLKSIY